MISIPPEASPRSAAMLRRINAALSKPGSTLPAQSIAPQLICEAWTADEFGLVIAEAFHDCNDMDGPHWPTVARKVADEIGLRLSRPDAADDATGGGATDPSLSTDLTPTMER